MILSYLMAFKQICNHPSHYLGHGVYDEKDSGKFIQLRELCEIISEKQEKVLVFTQYAEIIPHLHDFMATIFDQPGLVLYGGTPVSKRQALVESFQSETGPPFFILSLKAGGTGLNLTGASHVIHFDRWWNPAVENQATDRAYRIGQKKNVLVHKFVCQGTLEEKIDNMIRIKKHLASSVLGGAGGEYALTEMSNKQLLNMISLDIHQAILNT
jgi:non-specific serine/threonine protein kinase